MSATTYLLATRDPELFRVWGTFVPAGARVLTLNELVQEGAFVPAGLPVVLVLDEAIAGEVPREFLQAPMVFVGDQNGEVFERVSQVTGAVRVCLSREDCNTRLGEFLPLLEEIATRGATAGLYADRKNAAASSPVNAERRPRADEAGEAWWLWMGEAVEAMGDRASLLAEFRRAAKRLFHTSQAFFFLRDGNGYRADRGEFFSPLGDPLTQLLNAHPVVLDGVNWPANLSPVTEFSVRQRMGAWGVRLIVPLHDNGRLMGWLGLGLRDDGLAYSLDEHARAAGFARLLQQMLHSRKNTEEISGRTSLAAKYLPGVLFLGADEKPSDTVPAAVRSLIADVRRSRSTREIAATLDQPIRARAGIVIETQGVWVSWEDASADLQKAHQQARADRLNLLHDLALTLNHELGNSLVSLAALRHKPGAETNSPVLLAAIKRDIAALEAINRHLASLPTFSEVTPESVDLRALVHSVGRRCGVTVETGTQEVVLDLVPKLVEFGLEAILESVAENRPGLGKRELVVSLRAKGTGSNLTAVLAIRGPNLVLEGILPAPEPGSPPAHGRIGVFIAKEIVHLHAGTIEPNGVNAPEIIITLRRW